MASLIKTQPFVLPNAYVEIPARRIPVTVTTEIFFDASRLMETMTVRAYVEDGETTRDATRSLKYDHDQVTETELMELSAWLGRLCYGQLGASIS